MSRIKNFLSLTVLMIGGLVGASLLTHFSFSQNYWPTEENMFARTFTFRMPNQPVYLYAITAPNTYTIHFDGNWNTAWSMGSMPMTYDQEANLLANNFTKEWSTFRWWSRSSEWPVEFEDGTGVINLTAEDLWNVTLYAQRSEADVPYIVEYLLEKPTWSWYDSAGTGIEYGPAGPWVVTTGQIFTWFTLQTWEAINITSGGTVQYHYTRNTYNFTVVDRDREIVLLDTWVKYWVDITDILPENLTWWTWNTFEWWANIPEDNLMPAHDLEISAEWTIGQHSITFNTDGWSEIPPIVGNYWDPVVLPPNPTKPGYEFIWWDNEIPWTITKSDMTVKALWREAGEQNYWWWSGWWGRRWWDSWEDSPWEWEHGSAIGQSSEPIGNNRPTMEVLIAYMWAHGRWIVEESRKDSDPDGYVTRWAMAEMLVKFTENVIWKKTPAVIPEHCAWWDDESEWRSHKVKMYAEKSCALWVMWIRMQDFMPNKILDRAEFWTILSRLLWWAQYDVVDATATRPYYTRHLAALQREWVMTQISDPLIRRELRKWAWLMLMRVEAKIL